jgi:hypothetical protein
VFKTYPALDQISHIGPSSTLGQLTIGYFAVIQKERAEISKSLEIRARTALSCFLNSVFVFFNIGIGDRCGTVDLFFFVFTPFFVCFSGDLHVIIFEGVLFV